MKLPYRCRTQVIVLVLALTGSASGKGDPRVGSFTFADAAGVSGRLSLMVDTLKLKPAGFASGDTTGSIGILPGSHRFTVANAEAGSATATIPLTRGTSTTVIAYEAPGTDPQTHQPKKLLHLLQRLNPPPDSGRHFQLLYVSSQPSVGIVLNGVPSQVKSMREVNGPELPDGSISVNESGKSIVRFTAPQAGNFLVILYEGTTGKLAGLVVPDYK